MRLRALYLAGAVVVTAIPLSAEALSVQPDHQTVPRDLQTASAIYTCPHGFYWEPDAYAPHGKFRPAHCAPR